MVQNCNEGDNLMDARTTISWDELHKWVEDRKKWWMRVVYKVRSGSSTTVSMQSVFVPEQEFAFTTSYLLASSVTGDWTFLPFWIIDFWDFIFYF